MLTSAPSSEPEPSRPSASDTAQRFNGDQIRMAEKINDLERDNYKERDKIRERDARIRELEAKRTPDGALVLSGDDIALWEAYKGLGKPDEVSAKLTAATEATAERDTLKRRDTIRQVADASGYKPAVLERLGADLTYEIKDVTENGKTAKQVLVKDGDKTVPLKDYAAREWTDFLPALGGTEQPIVHGTPRRDVPRGTPPAGETPAPINIRL